MREVRRDIAGEVYEEFIEFKTKIDELQAGGINTINPDEIEEKKEEYEGKLRKFAEYFQACESAGIIYIYHDNDSFHVDDIVIEIKAYIDTCRNLEYVEDYEEESSPDNNIHHATISIMQAFGCKGNVDGVCHGISNMGMQASLLGADGISSFDDRMEFMMEIVSDAREVAEGNSEIRDKAKIDAKNAVEIEKANAHKVGVKVKPAKEKMLYDKAYDVAIIKAYLNSPVFIESVRSEKKLQDLLRSSEIFAQSVDLYFDPETYARDREFSGLFEENNKPKSQESDKILLLLQPKQLDETGGISVIKSNNESGHITRYFENHEKLESYLEAIMLNLRNKGVKESVSFLLSSGDHTITIGFHPDQEMYSFINSSYSKTFDNEYDLALHIAQAFAPGNIKPENLTPIILELSAYVSTKDEEVKKVIHESLNREMPIPDKAINSNSNAFRDQRSGTSLLDMAAHCDDIKTVNMLLNKGIDVNAKTKKGNTALMLAVSGQSIKSFDALIKHGASVNVLNKKNNSVLHCSAYEGNIEITKKLLHQSRQHLNTKNKVGFTPLHIAAISNHVEVVEVLLKAGAKIDIQDNDGNTPLHRAIMNNQPEMVGFLIDQGADVEIENKENQTALMLMLKDNEMLCVFQTKMIDQICELIKGNNIDDLGSILNYFEEIGFEIDLNAHPTKIPLKYAVEGNNEDIKNLLIKNGAKEVSQIRQENLSLFRDMLRKDQSELNAIVEAAGSSHYKFFESIINNLTKDDEIDIKKIEELIPLCLERRARVTTDKSPMREWVVGIVRILKENQNGNMNNSGFEKSVKEKMNNFPAIYAKYRDFKENEAKQSKQFTNDKETMQEQTKRI